MRRTLKLCLATLILLGLAAGPVMADVYKFKIGVETVMNHPRNKGLARLFLFPTRRSVLYEAVVWGR